MNVQSAVSVNRERVWDRLLQFAEIGRFGKTGVNRQAYTDGDLAAKRLVIRWAEELGFQVYGDAIGNIFVRREGRIAGAAPIVTGSHLDTEPTGGRFDGACGVVAGMEVLQRLHEIGEPTAHPIELAVWANEEGCRFQPGCMGSACYTDPRFLPEFLDTRSSNGIRLGDLVFSHAESLPELHIRNLGEPISAFVELHIEQGPVLEATHHRIGVVTGIQGRVLLDVQVHGRTGHAGTVPTALRQDALLRAVAVISDLEAVDFDEDTRFTIGRLNVEPNSPSVIPDHVRFTIDLRHPLNDTLAAILVSIGDVVGGRPYARLSIVDEIAPVEFSSEVIDAVMSSALAHGFDCSRLVSGAAHDAQKLAGFCPTGMVFIPCVEGISHHEDELTSPTDMEVGCNVLLGTVVRLDKSLSSATDFPAS
jgi:N-carbamoyl-L-amino-acid hydrolase